MTLTRSFIQTYFVVSESNNLKVLPSIEAGLAEINKSGRIHVQAPTGDEKEKISATIKYSADSESFYDMAHRIFEELNVLPIYRDSLLDVAKKVFAEDFEYERLYEVIDFNYKAMSED